MIYFISEDSRFANLFKNQILHLSVLIDYNRQTSPSIDLNDNIYVHIFSTFPNLVYLDCSPASFLLGHIHLKISNLPPMIYFSPRIIHLHINLETLDDCLCILDGRLANLRTLHVWISHIQVATIDTDNKVSISIRHSFYLMTRDFCKT